MVEIWVDIEISVDFFDNNENSSDLHHCWMKMEIRH